MAICYLGVSHRFFFCKHLQESDSKMKKNVQCPEHIAGGLYKLML